MPTRDSVVIPLNKTKMWLLAVGCVLLIIVGFLFVLRPWDLQSPLIHSILIIRILGFVSLVIFGYYLGVYVPKLSAKKPGLKIDEHGIVDNSSETSVGTILWEDIVAVEKKVVASSKFVVVKVKNPEDYIGRMSKRSHQKALHGSFKYFGTPIVISSSSLKCKFKKLEQLLQTGFQKYGNTSPE
ncbi:MAG TPA: STM3941 family protein [Chitinophagaceae bacterium]|nr:STM3941 family protein [Chitinophagaceae bacterium]